ncbi:MAG: hypothetical protein J7496_09955 [Novosphingobium sp.]|nr:hypothetical protein [Novosphingobium sp.]
MQTIYSGNVNAYQNTGIVKVQVDAGDVQDSTLELAGNTQEAVVVGNTGFNGLSLAGTAGATGAGIASVQIVADDSALTAANYGTNLISTNQITGSSVETSGNLNRAIAYAGSVSNTLDIHAETLTVDASLDGIGSQVYFNDPAPGGFVLDNDPATAPRVDAAYGLLNVQSASGSVSAENTSDEGSAMIVTTSGSDGGSSLLNRDNAIIGAAYGNDAANTAGLAVGNLTTSDGSFATVAADPATETSISTRDNLIQALAYGNRAGNAVAVTGTNIYYNTRRSISSIGLNAIFVALIPSITSLTRRVTIVMRVPSGRNISEPSQLSPSK